MEELEIRATKSQIEDFKESILWKDIKRELELWREMAKNEYSQVVGNVIAGNDDVKNSDMHLGSLYGREASIDYLLGMPDMFLQILEEEKEDESRLESTDRPSSG